MADPFIPPSLVPPGINDQRGRDFAVALSATLESFETSALLIQDPMTVDAALLPVMTIELGMTEFMTPGLREDMVRELLARAPEIHAMTGTVAGTRRALDAIGVTVDWTQWWQMEPKGYHDTHEVVAYVNEHLFDGDAGLLSAETQGAVRRVIEATQRWSQDIDFKLGLGFRSSAGLAGALERAVVARPTMGASTPMPVAAVGAFATLERASVVRRNAIAPVPPVAAASGLCAALSHLQFLHFSMEAIA